METIYSTGWAGPQDDQSHFAFQVKSATKREPVPLVITAPRALATSP